MWYIPKKFLCLFPLSLGALVVGVVMVIILIIIAIATLVQIIHIQDCPSCTTFTWRNCYGYSVTSFIYTIFMIVVNLWFFWGLKKKNTSVMLSWIVVSSMWLGQVVCLMIVLLYLHYFYSEDRIAALFGLIFGLIVIAILLYGLIVIIAHWLELKDAKKTPAVSA